MGVVHISIHRDAHPCAGRRRGTVASTTSAPGTVVGHRTGASSDPVRAQIQPRRGGGTRHLPIVSGLPHDADPAARPD